LPAFVPQACKREQVRGLPFGLQLSRPLASTERSTCFRALCQHLQRLHRCGHAVCICKSAWPCFSTHLHSLDATLCPCAAQWMRVVHAVCHADMCNGGHADACDGACADVCASLTCEMVVATLTCAPAGVGDGGHADMCNCGLDDACDGAC